MYANSSRRVFKSDMKPGSGTNSASIAFAAGQGQIMGKHLRYTSPGAGTLKFYRPDQKTNANAAVSNTTTLVIKTDAAGKVDGGLITTSDFVLVRNSATKTWYLATVSAAATVDASTVSLTLGSAITCTANDVIYIVRAASVSSMTVADATVDLYNAFCSVPGYPLYIVLAATGACLMTASIDVVE